MKILVSNDDGIHATGIRTLVESLAMDHEVYVSAPDRERSATGHALTLHKPIRVDEIDFGLPNVTAYSVSGTPSDCVKIALNAVLDIRPDVVVSGINHGPNLGADVLYSGTVSAALEGMINGVPSIAVSLVNGYEKMADFGPGATFIREYLPKLLAAGIPERTILNVNIPAVGLSDMSGIRVTDLGTRIYQDSFEKRMDPRGNVYYWLAGEIVETSDGPTTDVKVIRDNLVSITPVTSDMTNYAALETHKPLLEVTGSILPVK
ncbi:MAG: 5'/3'-nucleotidase SurE [Vampirovibrio sp.]|nr:5'/3'-nucleotidase SurE [Vampirovibrio sp.]